jgi:DNA-binding NarL/FixJ family response regulator
MTTPTQPTANHERITLLIVDDIPQVRQELRQLLELSGLVQVAGEASSGEEAVRLAAELMPEVVIMDLEMPGIDGCAATRAIKSRQPSPLVVILSIHTGPEVIARALEAGADSFVAKGASFETLLDAIQASRGGGKLSHFEKEN